MTIFLTIIRKACFAKKRIVFILGAAMLLLTHQVTQAQPVAKFSANVTAGCVPLAVQFQDLSTGNIVSRSWNLGAGTSTATNPFQLYTTGGTYTICLTVTDANGLKSTSCKNKYITAYSVPTAKFGYSPATSGCAPHVVQFSDSSVAGAGSIVQRLWDFGNGTFNGTKPTRTYTAAGAYGVTLKVTDANGCTDTAFAPNIIQVNAPPVADFLANATQSCLPPFAVAFANTTAQTGTNMGYLWNFGDGSPVSVTANPAHTYTKNGTYNVTLFAIDSTTGCKDTITKSAFIKVGTNVVVTPSSLSVCAGEPVQFTYTAGGTFSSWLWNFGDGNSSTVANPTHAYAGSGCYTVTLTGNVNGCIITTSTTACIQVTASPNANVIKQGNSVTCSFPHTLSYNANSSTATAWLWDFGDGTTATVKQPTKTYNSYGNFVVSLTVTNAKGCSRLLTVDTVRIEPLEANFSAPNTGGCAPLLVSFSDLSTSSAFPINSWKWYFGDGDSSSLQNPNHIYADTGTFAVMLIVTNTNGCADTFLLPDYVRSGMQPSLSFTPSPTNACFGSTVKFINNSSTFADAWVWSFGDTNTAYVFAPTHFFEDTGYFNITLLAHHNFCYNQLTVPNAVKVSVPRAVFGRILSCETPYTVKFTSYSVQADSVFWHFGVSGTTIDTSSEKNVTVTFPKRGDYTVSLTAFNSASGCSHKAGIILKIRDPEANFSVQSLTGCAPYTLPIADNSIDANTFKWSSDSGNLTSANDSIPNLTYDQAGFYNGIQLIVTDIYGCKDTARFDDTIRVSDVYPKFSATPADGCSPLLVNYADSSTTFLGNLVTYQWTFGDGAGSNNQNPTHLYTQSGLYTPTLTVMNSFGCQRTDSLLQGIRPTFPVVSFTTDSVGCTGQILSFNNQSQGTNLLYKWSFGDGSTDTATSPIHAYQQEGIYDICLEAVDINGCRDTVVCHSQSIQILDPKAGFTVNDSITTCFNLNVQFIDTSKNAIAWEWNFGDSTTSTLQSPTHLYSNSGKYDVCLVITGFSGCKDTICKPAFIQVNSPQAAFSIDQTSGCPPLSVTFTATGQNVKNFIWVFGDGSTFTQPANGNDTLTFTHLYSSGAYAPLLIAESSDSCQIIINNADSINVELLDIGFVLSDSVICDTGTVVCYPQLNSGVTITDILWQVTGPNNISSTDSIPTFFFGATGIYTVKLTAATATCTQSASQTVSVFASPTAEFITSPSSGCVPLTVSFTNTSFTNGGGGLTYLWSFDTVGTSNLPQPTFVFSQPDTLRVRLVATSQAGCTDTVHHRVIAHPKPDAQAGADITVCRTEPIQLHASGGLQYNWFPANGLSCTNCPDPIAIVVTPTPYIVTMTNEFGCIGADTVLVNTLPYYYPGISVSDDTTICAGNVVQLRVQGNAATPLSYAWDATRIGLSCYTSCSNPFASPLVTTTYIATVTGEGGCQASDSITVTVVEPDQNIADSNRTICLGESVQLSAFAGTDHVWSPYTGLSCAFCPNPVATPTQTTAYIVTAKNAMGCIIRDTVTVTVLNPQLYGAGEDLTICPTRTAQLNATVTGIFAWAADPSLSDINTPNPIASPNQTTTYYLTIDNGSCIFTDSVTVFVQPKAEIFTSDVTICQGDTASLLVQGRAQAYQWLPAESLNDPNSANPLAFPTQTTLYSVIGTLDGCASDTAWAVAYVRPLPLVGGYPYQYVFEGQSVALNVGLQVNPSFTYQWSPDENQITCLDCPNPLIIALKDSVTYYVTVTTDLGCSATDSVQIRFADNCQNDLIVVPNAFSPNGDGLNDVLYVRGTALQEVFSFRIFSRNGDMIFETSDISEGWDGRHGDKLVNAGVYVYVVEAPCPATGELVRKHGNITVMR